MGRAIAARICCDSVGLLAVVIGMNTACAPTSNSGGLGESDRTIFSNLTRQVTFALADETYSIDTQSAAASLPPDVPSISALSGGRFVGRLGIRVSLGTYGEVARGSFSGPEVALNIWVRGFSSTTGLTQPLTLDLADPASAQFVEVDFIVEGPATDIIGSGPTIAYYGSATGNSEGIVEIRRFEVAEFPEGFSSNVLHWNIDVRLRNVRLERGRAEPSGDQTSPQSATIVDATIQGFLNPIAQ